jgi:SAM-dependent methyltransferase
MRRPERTDRTSAAFTRALLDGASAPYRSAGRFAWYFARGKLNGDPAFLGLLERGLIPDDARILDLGCGQGLLAAWLLEVRALFDAGPLASALATGAETAGVSGYRVDAARGAPRPTGTRRAGGTRPGRHSHDRLR